jgi:uncharacterized damage-inducible protein DinB
MHAHLEEVFSLLDESRTAVHAALATVEPRARAVRPGPDRWSVNEILEHLALVEGNFEAIVGEALAAARAKGLEDEQHARVRLPADLRAVIRDRATRRKAPDSVVPTGTLDEAAAWAALEQARQRFRATVSAADDRALGTVTAAHRRWGPLTIYQWVELLATHEVRHADQIADVATHFGSVAV